MELAAFKILGKGRCFGSEKPELKWLPPMFRRRLTPLSRLIFASLENLREPFDLSSMPIVIASRFGHLKVVVPVPEKRSG